MKKRIGAAFLFLAVVITLSFKAVTKETRREVTVVSITNGKISHTVKATGRVESVEETVIRAKLEGMIKELFVEEGDKVKKGDVLAVYDSDFYKNNFEKALITLKEAELRLKEAEKRSKASERIKYDPLEYDLALKERQTQYDTALINLKKKKREYERALSLFKSRIVSNQVLEQNRDELNQAETLLKQAGKNLEDSKRLSSRRERTNLNIYSMETERNRLLLATKKARTDVRYWKTQIEKLKVIAPHNGVVINKKAENGVLLNAGMEIVTIADVANLRISAEIDEVDAGRITEKMQGVVRFDAFPGERFKAEVTDVSPRAEIKSGRTVVETKLRLLQPTEKLKINNQVEAEILLQTKENVPLVPLESLVSEKKGYSIWTVNDLDALTKKRIETGISDLSKIEITGGLKEGDRVALPGGKPFSENEKIQPVLKKSE